MTMPAWQRSALLDAHMPAVVPLGGSLVGAAFPLMKVFPAFACIERAIADGRLPDTRAVVVETTSGTTALAVAIVAHWFGRRVIVSSGEDFDPIVQLRLHELAASTERAPTSDGVRIDFEDTDASPAAYARVAERLVDSLGDVHCLVGTVGSGSSMCGLARRLRSLVPNLHVIGVDTVGSVLFGRPEQPRASFGLGSGRLPRNLDRTVFDDVHWVTAAEACTATRRLYASTALLRGASSGAAWLVARYWADRHPEARTVCLLPDEGSCYLDSIFDDDALRSRGLLLDDLPAEPCVVPTPVEAEARWSCIAWRHHMRQIHPPSHH